VASEARKDDNGRRRTTLANQKADFLAVLARPNITDATNAGQRSIAAGQQQPPRTRLAGAHGGWLAAPMMVVAGWLGESIE